jgi:hypothetical protein
MTAVAFILGLVIGAGVTWAAFASAIKEQGRRNALKAQQ